MKLPCELLDLGDAALEDQVAVVRLALGDLAGDGGEHQILYFSKILGLAQGPGQLDVGHLGQHVLGRNDALGHQVAAGVVDEHVHVAPQRLHRHVDGHSLLGGAHDGRVERLVDMTQPGAGDDNAPVAVLDHGVDHVGLHVGVVIEHSHILLEERQDGDIAVAAPAVVVGPKLRLNCWKLIGFVHHALRLFQDFQENQLVLVLAEDHPSLVAPVHRIKMRFIGKTPI
jgi:hypothetical protein